MCRHGCLDTLMGKARTARCTRAVKRSAPCTRTQAQSAQRSQLTATGRTVVSLAGHGSGTAMGRDISLLAGMLPHVLHVGARNCRCCPIVGILLQDGVLLTGLKVHRSMKVKNEVLASRRDKYSPRERM